MYDLWAYNLTNWVEQKEEQTSYYFAYKNQ
jgi:hypothetical protein